MKDYYRILQVGRFASSQEIKQSYRKLVLRYHPDKNAGNPHSHELFLEIREAYEILSDSFKRQWYDQLFFSPAQPQMVYTSPAPQPFFVRRDVPMNKRDKQIFYGGIALFLVVLSVLYYIFIPGIEAAERANTYTDWSIRDSEGNEKRLTQYQFDSLLNAYNLKPGQVKELIDSLRYPKY